MAPVEQQILDTIRALPPDQRQEVLDFAEFLQSKQLSASSNLNPPQRPKSALELAGDLVGCLQGGPDDLSSNPKYLEEFGSV